MNAAHQHDEFEINLITSGRCTYMVGGEPQQLRARTLLWLFPDQPHLLLNWTRDFAMWILVVSPELVEEMMPRVPIFAERDPGSVFKRVLPPKCVRLLETVAQELSTGFQPLDAHELGFEWWVASAWNAYQHGDSQDAGPLHSAVARAMALLRENPAKNLKALAQETRISPSQLSRLFKRQAGISITDFRNRLRLESFVSRCDSTGESAMFALARDAGFGSYAQFSRVFRRQMGCSPEAYYRDLRQHKRTSRPAEKPVLVSSARSP
jgi:AraC-like DNA-binding protein